MLRILLLCLLFSLPVFAADKKAEKDEAASEAVVEVPEITFAQKVDMVVSMKKDPRVLDVKIEQQKRKITVDVIVDKNQDQEEAKGLALTAVMLIKSKCLDDPIKDRATPGKGLYDYTLNFSRPNGVRLLQANKPAKKAKLSFENPDPVVAPATREDVDGL